jgi:hypothetical protein
MDHKNKTYWIEYIAHLKSEIKKEEKELKFFKEELQSAEKNYHAGKNFME